MAKAAAPCIGLALGAGGARGLAHVSVLEALDEMGLKASRIAGTSIGAIIGAAYASGMTGREIRAHTLKVLGEPAQALGKLMELRPRRLRGLFDQGVLNAVQLDAERTVELFLPAGLAPDFSQLLTPLSIIATDFYGWSECEIAEGPLRPAIACSIALPPILKPVLYEGRVMVDGGMVNPLPADKLDGADITIAIDVVSGPEPRDGREIPSAMDAIFGTTQILMQSVIAARLAQGRPDILLRPPINEFRVLDFLKARAVLAAGDSIKEDFKRQLDRVLKAQ